MTARRAPLWSLLLQLTVLLLLHLIVTVHEFVHGIRKIISRVGAVFHTLVEEEV